MCIDEEDNPVTTETRTREEAVGELRQQLLAAGWRSDFRWSDVGSATASAAVRAAGGEATRRTIAYLSSLRAVDGGAAKVWMDGDVPAPRQADAREVMLATPADSDWQSETFEAPVVTVADDEDRDARDERSAVHEAA